MDEDEAGRGLVRKRAWIGVVQQARTNPPPPAREAGGGEGSGVGGGCHEERSVRLTGAGRALVPYAVTRPNPKRSSGNICGNLRLRNTIFGVRRRSVPTSPISPVTNSESSLRSMAGSILVVRPTRHALGISKRTAIVS